MAKKVSAGGAEVRAFLVAQGVTVGSRGRFSAEQVEAFEKATGKRYVVGHVEPITVKGTRVSDSGRKTPVSRKTTLSEVRTWAQSPEAAALGVQAASKGRIAAPVLAAFAAHAPKV